MTKDCPAKPPETPSGLSELELAHLRARFHAAQFRYTSALAAESGKTNDGVFRIHGKPETKTNVTQKLLEDQWEVIESMHGSNPEDNCPVEVIEPEYDFKPIGSDSGSSEEEEEVELTPNEIEKLLDHDHRDWLDEILEADPDVSVAVKNEISKRKTERGKHKIIGKQVKEKVKEATNGVTTNGLILERAMNPGLPLIDDIPHVFNQPSDQPFVPVCVESHEFIMSNEKKQEEHDLSPDKKRSSADPLFDCVEQDIVLDDQYLMEIAHGLKKGVTYDNTYVTDDLKKKLLDIENNKEKVDNQIVVKALETSIKTDETAQKIVEALTNQDVIAKTMNVEDSKILKEYFNGNRKVDESVLNALNRVIDCILDRAPEFYDNKEELAAFMRNRATAKMHLLDAMLAKKGNWLSNLYGSAYNTAMAVVAGVNATVEAVNKGVTAAKNQTEYAKKIAEQTTTAAKELINSETVKNAQAQAIKFGSMAATMAGAMASKVSTATSALSTSASSTDTTTLNASTTIIDGTVGTTSTDGTLTSTEETTTPADFTTSTTDSNTNVSNEVNQNSVTIVTIDSPVPVNNQKLQIDVLPGIKETKVETLSAVSSSNDFLQTDQCSLITSSVTQPVPTGALPLSPTNTTNSLVEQESIYYTMWSAFKWVLSMPYGVDHRSFTDSPPKLSNDKDKRSEKKS